MSNDCTCGMGSECHCRATDARPPDESPFTAPEMVEIGPVYRSPREVIRRWLRRPSRPRCNCAKGGHWGRLQDCPVHGWMTTQATDAHPLTDKELVDSFGVKPDFVVDSPDAVPQVTGTRPETCFVCGQPKPCQAERDLQAAGARPATQEDRVAEWFYLRIMSERAAVARDGMRFASPGPFSELSPSVKEGWRREARAVIRVVRKAGRE